MRICGSCHTLVTAEDDVRYCPRCKDDLDPSALQILRRFVQHGMDTSKGGPTQTQMREAALVAIEMMTNDDE